MMEYSGLNFKINKLYDYNAYYNNEVIGRICYDDSKIKAYYQSNLIYEENINESLFHDRLPYVAWELRKELVVENKEETIYKYSSNPPKKTIRKLDFFDVCDDVCDAWQIDDCDAGSFQSTLERWLMKNGYDITMTR
jgi:hypothetical protein